MHTLTLNIKDNAYGNILYFLKNLSSDVEILSDKVTENKSTKKETSLRGVFSQYADSSKTYLEDKAWEIHTIEKYKKENS
jgi:hypothetical protein